MTDNNIEKRLEELADAIPASDGFVDKVMSRIESESTPSKASYKIFARYAAAAMIMLAAILTVSVILSGPDAIAWADVVAQVSEFRPYGCDVTTAYEGRDPYTRRVLRPSLTKRREVWPGGKVRVFDLEAMRMITLDTENKIAVAKALSGTGPRKDPDMLSMVANVRNGDSVEKLGTKTIDGIETVGFHAPDAINDLTVWADAKIDGDKVVVSSNKVSAPVAVRYAWADNPVCNLYNAEELPASPFRTDSWPGVTINSK